MESLNYSQRKLLESKVLLENELFNRRSNDPLKDFELFSPQTEFVEAIIKPVRKENYYMGANRSGKSDAGAYA